MKFKLIFFLAVLLTIAVSSCGSLKFSKQKTHLRSLTAEEEAEDQLKNYVGSVRSLNPNYKLRYVVDTITINSPLYIYYNGYEYVVPLHVWEYANSHSANLYSFFKRTDIYLLSKEYFLDMDGKDFSEEKIDEFENHQWDENFLGEQMDKKKLGNDTIFVIKFKAERARFLLSLVNIYWFNYNHATIDESYPYLDYEDDKNLYYKVVYYLPNDKGIKTKTDNIKELTNEEEIKSRQDSMDAIFPNRERILNGKVHNKKRK